jgi:hypothetical protein
MASATAASVDQTSNTITIKGKEALVDAVEDVVFGSVGQLTFEKRHFAKSPSDRWCSW